jgi:hypothetical protein
VESGRDHQYPSLARVIWISPPEGIINSNRYGAAVLNASENAGKRCLYGLSPQFWEFVQLKEQLNFSEQEDPVHPPLDVYSIL